MNDALVGLLKIIVPIACFAGAFFILWKIYAGSKREKKNYERALKMVPMLIHLPPSTEDIQGGGRDDRDVTNEELSEAQVMYSIIASTLKKGFAGKLYGQKHISFEIVAHNGFIKYYTVVPAVLTETMRQAVTAAYPSARLEEIADPNFFNENSGIEGVAGGELQLKQSYCYPIATYEDTKRDASLALINALSTAKQGDGVAIQIMFRPTDGSWIQKSLQRVQNIKDGKAKNKSIGSGLSNAAFKAGEIFGDAVKALWEPPGESAKNDPLKKDETILTNLQQEEIQKLEEKTKHPGFEVLIRVVASTESKPRSEALLANVVSVFSQFDLPNYNGFRYDALLRPEDLAKNYLLRLFPPERTSMVLNSVEMASLFHLPSQKSIPTSQVERQATKQVDGPAKLPEEGVILGINEFRGEKKVIRLSTKDRQRHTYVIGATGMGKSILLTNIAYQDMCDGRGFAFIDPHGDAVELLLSKVPKERADDIIVFEPGNMDNPVGMNMFEFQREDQKDFIVQEGINMLVSLYDPGNQGIFGARAQHMFRNAALLLMSDPNGGTFIDIPRCFIDPEFVKEKLQYVNDKTVYDYWTKEFPQSQKSNDAGEVTTWFVSKWGPFLSNTMMRNILGQPKSGFNIREIMDNKKILLVNLSKGTTGELNAKLLGMIFVMKFQAAAMSRADTPEDQRVDFCLFVDEFQNFATESFESILSEARKYKLNLVLANQFMTQLTDKIREAILGNVGTIMCGRIGVTDAEIMQKAFQPVFNAEDLHKIPNHQAVTTVLMFGLPTSPFTLNLLPPLGESSHELMLRMKEYALSRFGRPRAEVEAEIEERLGMKKTKEEEAEDAKAAAAGLPAPKREKKNFLDAWMDKKADMEAKAKQKARETIASKGAEATKPPVATAPAASAAPVPPAAQVVPPVPAVPNRTPIAPTVAPAAGPAPMPSSEPVIAPVTATQAPTGPKPVPVSPVPVKTADKALAEIAAAPVAAAASVAMAEATKTKNTAAPVATNRSTETKDMLASVLNAPASAVPAPVPASAAEPVAAVVEPEAIVEDEPEEELLAVDTGMVWSVAAAENVGADTTSIRIAHEPRSMNVNTDFATNNQAAAAPAPAAAQEQSVAAKQDDGLFIQHDDDGAVVRWR